PTRREVSADLVAGPCRPAPDPLASGLAPGINSSIELSTSAGTAEAPRGWVFVRRSNGGGASAVAVAMTGRRMALRAAIAFALACTGLVVWVAAGGTTGSAGARNTPILASLDSSPVPSPPDETKYIRDSASAVKL